MYGVQPKVFFFKGNFACILKNFKSVITKIFGF